MGAVTASFPPVDTCIEGGEDDVFSPKHLTSIEHAFRFLSLPLEGGGPGWG
jgi:hypothetical protein